MKIKWYAVLAGKHPGIYKSWAECKEQTHGISGAEFKSFPTEHAAITWLKENGPTPTPPEPAPLPPGSPDKIAVKRDRSPTPTQ